MSLDLLISRALARARSYAGWLLLGAVVVLLHAGYMLATWWPL